MVKPILKSWVLLGTLNKNIFVIIPGSEWIKWGFIPPIDWRLLSRDVYIKPFYTPDFKQARSISRTLIHPEFLLIKNQYLFGMKFLIIVNL